MNFVLQPWQLLIAILAGWIHRQQQEVIEYLRTENQILKEKLGKRRIPLTDDQRRRLAAKGRVLGRKVLESIGRLVTPDTILRWHRLLVAQKGDFSDRAKKKPGRPPVADEIRTLVVRLASENTTWGYDRIQGALANLGHTLSDATVGNILKQHGIDPAPDRKRQTTWQTFLQAHWDVLAAIDFTTVEVWTKTGLVTFYLLFVIELATRRVHFAGCTTNPDQAWMKQIARNLTDAEEGFLSGNRYVLMDRDAKFCEAFRNDLQSGGVESVRLPPRSPNCNAHSERFMRSLKEECLDRLIFFRRIISAPGRSSVPGALSHGTQPPRLGQSPHQRGRRGRAFHRRSAVSGAPRGRLALLLPIRRLAPFVQPRTAEPPGDRTRPKGRVAAYRGRTMPLRQVPRSTTSAQTIH
jgi:putative transposase